MKRSLFAVAIVSAAAGQAMAAEEGGKPMFQINQSLYTHTSTNTETKPDGQSSSKVKTTEGQTVPQDLEVVVGFSDLFIHFRPVGGRALMLGWGGVKNLEVGLALSDERSTVDKPNKLSNNDTSIGLYGTYTIPVGKPLIELSLAVNSVSGTDESTNAQGAKEKTTTTGMNYGLSASYIQPILGGLSYMFALGYTADSSEQKTSGVKTKVTTGELNVTPVGLRFDF